MVVLRHLPRATLVVGIGAMLAVGGLSFFNGTHPSALIQRAWSRVSISSEPVTVGDTVLSVLFDEQDHALSCEVAALKMALAYRNVFVDEETLLNAVGVDATPRHFTSVGMVWGNPHKAFVGDVDGRMLANGYGVYWEPIARAAAPYRKAQALERMTPIELAEYIEDGNPVIVWGFVGSGRRLSWTTPDGIAIPAVEHEHVYVVHGFRGASSAPEGFFLMDPVYGERYQTTEEFVRVWSALDFSGVVIF